MFRFPLWSFLIAASMISAALVTTVSAQPSTPKPAPAETTRSTKPGDAPPRDATFSLFGDAKRFSRLGGWGGMGATMGQFGLSKAMLVMTPGVQRELKLTDKQKQDLQAWSDSYRKKGEALAKTGGIMGPDGPPGGSGGDPSPTNGGPGDMAARAMGMMNFMSSLSEFFREAEGAANKILNRSQRTRLNQIALQMEGLSALSKPEMAEALNLAPQQYEAIQQVLNDARSGQMRYWVTQMAGFRPPGGRPPSSALAQSAPRSNDTGSKTPKAAKADSGVGKPDGKAPSEPEEDPAVARRKAQRIEAQARFQKMRQGSDQIQDVAVVTINKLLSKKQRATFDKMLGEPFDPDAVLRQPEEAARAKAAETKSATKKAEAPAAKGVPSLRERRAGADFKSDRSSLD